MIENRTPDERNGVGRKQHPADPTAYRRMPGCAHMSEFINKACTMYAAGF